MQTDLAIAAVGVSKRFGRVAALRGVDLQVPRGETFGLIGPNGAGKTTFIKVLLGIVQPGDGEVRVFGGAPRAVATRRRVGYLPENLQLPRAWRPGPFLRSVARLKGLGWSRAEADSAIAGLLRRVGLDEAAWGQRMGGFSKGMRQRTGLATALLGQPDLLILDEPTDGIDPLGRAAIREVIREEAARGATVFLNSHLLAETERICAAVAVMAQGRIVRAGALDTLRSGDRYRLVATDTPQARSALTSMGWQLIPTAGSDGRFAQATGSYGDPEALSAALGSLLSAGVQVVELRRELTSLEAILADAVAGETAVATQ